MVLLLAVAGAALHCPLLFGQIAACHAHSAAMDGPSAPLQLAARVRPAAEEAASAVSHVPADRYALVPVFHPRPIDGMHSNDVNAPFYYRPPGAKAGAFHVMSDTAPLPGGCSIPPDPQAQLDSGCCKGWR
eukprot:SAG31_NODE_5480_length_2514_cov_1.932919_1_plen_131_part_00